MENKYLVVFITTPSTKIGEQIAEKLVAEKLAACVNILPEMMSIYIWKGEICNDSEVLLIVKTRADLFEALSATVQTLHPYEVPEVLAIPVSTGSDDYLSWIRQVTQP